jgi:DNA-directed RNA polymerase I subunit RPA2
VNGIERCIRLLQIPRRNYATAIQRSNFKNRGPTYTDLGVVVRSSRYNHDQTSLTNTIHYLTTGGVTIKFTARKQEFLIPIVLIVRALSGGGSSSSTTANGDSSNNGRTDYMPTIPSSFDDADMAGGGGRSGYCMGITDEELYRRIVQCDHTNTFLVARANLLLQDARARFGTVNTPNECLAYLGERFRRLSQRAETTSNMDIGHYMIRNYILIHLPNYKDKLECLLFMLRKLYAFAAGDCGVDNADSLQNQEILLPGHLLSAFVKEKFDEFYQALRLGLLGLLRKDYPGTCTKLQATNFWSAQVDRFSMKSSGGIGKKVAHLLSTGNIVSTTGLDLMQVSGYTIVAERLNFLRYCAHFRSVHRGSFFMEMKTTTVRKLLPDQWGFLCPVHTPDGGPCGLLSHMALKAVAMAYPAQVTDNDKVQNLDGLLFSLGVSPVGAGGRSGDGHATSTYLHLPVIIDGRSIGGASPVLCRSIAVYLRRLKVENPPTIPPTIEVALIPPGNAGAPYAGLYLFTGAARLIRPVLQRASGKTEFLGPLEQAFMDIACLDEDIREGITTHQELDPMNMLSLIASLTPFSDQNQSPRNMYQCQMGKQTMGTPCHSLPYRPDNKLYRLQTPQAPIVQTGIHGMYKMDEYPNGTNAVVGTLQYDYVTYYFLFLYDVYSLFFLFHNFTLQLS